MAESVSHTPFAVFNKTGNPIVATILRSPLHPMLSRHLALITVTGRTSGREYTFPVAYSRDGEVVTIEVGWPERKRWWRNLRGAGAPVAIRIAGQARTGHALASGDESSGVEVKVELDS